jgi:23S rRNA U2552 (ribose-2'-O)-methylase RlmE/FtsJ
MGLWLDFLTNDDRFVFKWKHYIPIYERHFARFINLDTTMIEIGCGQGGSVKMWKRFLGPHAKIIGVDNNPDCHVYAEDQIDILIGDQSDKGFMKSLVDEFGTPDIVLDDGSHIMSHQRASFSMLYPLLSKNGVYMVEDLHTAYWDEYEGGLRREGTFIEMCKGLIDELNADHFRPASPTEFTHSTNSINFYDSVIVFEKGRTTKKQGLMIGRDPSSAHYAGARNAKY